MNYAFHPEAEREFIETAARYEAEIPGLGTYLPSPMEVEHRGIGKREKLSDTPGKLALRIQHDLWYIQNGAL